MIAFAWFSVVVYSLTLSAIVTWKWYRGVCAVCGKVIDEGGHLTAEAFLDAERMDAIEKAGGVFFNGRYGGWRMSKDGGINDKPWYFTAREATDAEIARGGGKRA